MYSISKQQLDMILRTLEKGDRVELIPCKDGVKILKVKREIIK